MGRGVLCFFHVFFFFYCGLLSCDMWKCLYCFCVFKGNLMDNDSL